jgi:capsid portal protein
VCLGLSFKELRRQVRADAEQTGNGYIEVFRNLENQVIVVRYVRPASFALCAWTPPIVVEKKVIHDGQKGKEQARLALENCRKG